MKKIRTTLIICLFTTAICLMAGCGGRDEVQLENELAYRQIGIQKLSEGSYQEAVDSFQKALDQSVAVVEELEVDICYYKAQAQYQGGDVEGAIETYTALIDYDKDNVKALYLRGTAYLAQGQTKEALADYQAAADREKKDGELHSHIAENLIHAGMNQEAEPYLQAAVGQDGEDAESLRERGYAFYLMGDYDNARANLDKAITLEDEEAVFYLAKIEDALGNSQRATQLYETYISTHEGDTATLYELGMARLKQGSYDQALTFFQKALETENPANRQQLRRGEIIALEYLLDFGQARAKLESYVADYPEDAEAAREWEFLQSR